MSYNAVLAAQYSKKNHRLVVNGKKVGALLCGNERARMLPSGPDLLARGPLVISTGRSRTA